MKTMWWSISRLIGTGVPLPSTMSVSIFVMWPGNCGAWLAPVRIFVSWSTSKPLTVIGIRYLQICSVGPESTQLTAAADAPEGTSIAAASAIGASSGSSRVPLGIA